MSGSDDRSEGYHHLVSNVRYRPSQVTTSWTEGNFITLRRLITIGSRPLYFLQICLRPTGSKDIERPGWGGRIFIHALNSVERRPLIYAKTRNWGPGGLEAPIFFSAQNETGYPARNETAASAGVEPAETMKTLKTAWKHRRFCGFGAFLLCSPVYKMPRIGGRSPCGYQEHEKR